jgi:hypothetical protein
MIVGGSADATNTGGFNGLIKRAVDIQAQGVTGVTATNQSATAFATDAFTTDNLLELRKNLGKYGVRPQEVVYLVSQRAYFELLEDAEFADANIVTPTLATKLVGEIGTVYGSRVMLVDEYAVPAVNKFYAAAVHPRSFVVPRLRGATLESQYVPRLQHRELIATQRLGFDQIIPVSAANPNTPICARQYAAA